MLTDMWIWIMLFVSGLFIIIKSAGYAVEAAINYAEKTGFSKYFVGLLIVSIGTSLPELFTGIISSLQGSSGLIIGDALGATIVDITLVLGMVGVVAKKLKISGKSVSLNIYHVMPVVILPIILGFDGMLSRIDGALMLAAFFIYYAHNIIRESKKQSVKKNIKFKWIWQEVVIFGLNIGMIIFGAQLLVVSSVNIVSYVDIPIYIFGAAFLAICTTSPEFIVELKAIAQKSSPVAFGDIFGSVICNNSLVLGVAALIMPTALDRTFFLTTACYAAFVVFVGLVFIGRGEINRKEGIFLSSLFIVFVMMQVVLLR